MVVKCSDLIWAVRLPCVHEFLLEEICARPCGTQRTQCFHEDFCCSRDTKVFTKTWTWRLRSFVSGKLIFSCDPPFGWMFGSGGFRGLGDSCGDGLVGSPGPGILSMLIPLPSFASMRNLPKTTHLRSRLDRSRFHASVLEGEVVLAFVFSGEPVCGE